MPLGLKFQINHLIRLTRISDMDYIAWQTGMFGKAVVC